MRFHFAQAAGACGTLVTALVVAVGLLTLGLPSDAKAVIVAADGFDSSLNLSSFDQTPSLADVEGTWGAGDWFGQLDPTSPPAAGIPYSIADDSAGDRPTDTLGVVDSSPDSNATSYTSGYKSDKYFGVADIENSNFSGTATATWDFNISGAAQVTEISIDMGAMGNFESANDRFDWFYQIDSGPRTPLFTSSIGEGTVPTYIMANGNAITDLPDPVIVNGEQLLADKTPESGLPTRTAAISGSGSMLTLFFEAEANGGEEAYVFDNILIIGEPGTGVLLGDVNLDGDVNGLDVDPFVDRVTGGTFQAEADMNKDGWVNGLDVEPFVAAVVGGGAQAVPEPSTVVLTLIGLVGLWGYRRR
jgi:hypothetical protein